MAFEEDVAVDINSLDTEWERQSSVYLRCSKDYAEALYNRDHHKFRLDTVRADLDADIRNNPEHFGLDKITEAAVANAILGCKDYKQAMDEYIESNRDVNMLLAAKSAMEHKKKALEKLTDLYLSGYWSEPKISGEAKEGYEKDVSARSASTLKGSGRMKRLKNKRTEEKNGQTS